MLEEIKEEALNNNIPIIMDDTLEEIMKRLQEIKPSKILEIGTAVGYSSICFSKWIRNDGYIDTIELDEERAKKAIENIKRMNLQDKIHVIVGNAIDILPTLNCAYNVIFIDAAKSKYPIFLNEAIRLVKIGGFIFADNILYKGYVLGNYSKHKQRTAVKNLREYIKLVTENKNLSTQILDIGDRTCN